MDDKFGALTFTRIYSGTIKKGDTVLNSFTGKTERISRMVEMHADDRKEIDSAQAGDIVAIVGLKNVQTGHTLCDEKNPATLEPMVFPDPVISIAVAPKDKANAEKLANAIGKMIQEDPSFRVETDEETNEMILKGMGELHLDIKIDILKRTHKVEVTVGAPQVAYRETITKAVNDSYTHKKQSGGSGQFAKIDYTIEPGEAGSGFIFESKVVGGNVPKEFIPAVEKGFKTSIDKGPLAGYPCLDFKVTLNEGGFHAVDSSPSPSKSPPRPPTARPCRSARPQILEPMMKLDVFTPDEKVGDVIGDLNRRRGMIQGQEPTPRWCPRQGRGSAVRHVRLHRRPPHHDLRPRPVLHGVQPLRPLPEKRLRRRHRQGQGQGRSPPRRQVTGARNFIPPLPKPAVPQGPAGFLLPGNSQSRIHPTQ